MTEKVVLYEGEYFASQANGYGVGIKANGVKKEGEWRDGKIIKLVKETK